MATRMGCYTCVIVDIAFNIGRFIVVIVDMAAYILNYMFANDDYATYMASFNLATGFLRGRGLLPTASSGHRGNQI